MAQLLGRREVGCFDLKAGCPASPLAMHAGMALIASGLANRVLIVAAEVEHPGQSTTPQSTPASSATEPLRPSSSPLRRTLGFSLG